MGRKENENVGIYTCHGQGGNQVNFIFLDSHADPLPFQVFSYTMDKEIRIDDLCLDVAKSGAAVQMVKCHHMKGNQLWEFNEKVKKK